MISTNGINRIYLAIFFDISGINPSTPTVCKANISFSPEKRFASTYAGFEITEYITAINPEPDEYM